MGTVQESSTHKARMASLGRFLLPLLLTLLALGSVARRDAHEEGVAGSMVDAGKEMMAGAETMITDAMSAMGMAPGPEEGGLMEKVKAAAADALDASSSEKLTF